MKFINFKIKNFKGIKELDLRLNKSIKIYTLVGLNESGKTSILEAIDAFYNTIKQDDRHKLIPKSTKSNFNKTIEISASLELSYKDKAEIEKYIKEKGYQNAKVGEYVNVERKYEFQNSLPTKFTSLWTIEILIRKKEDVKFKKLVTESNTHWNEVVSFIEKDFFPDIIYYPNFLFDFPDKIFLEENGTSEFDQYYNVIQDILYSIDPKLNIGDHLLSRLKTKTASSEEALEATLSKMSSKVSEVVFKAWAKLFQRGKKEIVIRAGSESVGGKVNYFLQFRLKEGSDHFFIAERSLGFKWFFSFLLFTEFRKNRVTDKSELLFLLDEPASNLHSTAQRNLLSTFAELINKSYLIYTTHSHHLINPEWINGIFIVKNKALNYSDEENFDSNQTDIEISLYRQFVAKYPNQREYFQPILDTLDYQPGLLEKIPSVIITEGKGDYFVFKYMLRVYLANKYQLNFYPGGGANSDSEIIKLYLAWERNFIILRDSDKAGKNAIKAYQQQFKEELKGKTYDYSDISGSLGNISVEGLFTEADRIKICKSLDPSIVTYEKSKFHYSIQLLLSESGRIDLDPLTVENFETVFRFLESKIS